PVGTRSTSRWSDHWASSSSCVPPTSIPSRGRSDMGASIATALPGRIPKTKAARAAGLTPAQRAGGSGGAPQRPPAQKRRQQHDQRPSSREDVSRAGSGRVGGVGGDGRLGRSGG